MIEKEDEITGDCYLNQLPTQLYYKLLKISIYYHYLPFQSL